MLLPKGTFCVYIIFVQGEFLDLPCAIQSNPLLENSGYAPDTHNNTHTCSNHLAMLYIPLPTHTRMHAHIQHTQQGQMGSHQVAINVRAHHSTILIIIITRYLVRY